MFMNLSVENVDENPEDRDFYSFYLFPWKMQQRIGRYQVVCFVAELLQNSCSRSSPWMMSQPPSVWGMTHFEQSLNPEGKTENSPGQESRKSGQ